MHREKPLLEAPLLARALVPPIEAIAAPRAAAVARPPEAAATAIRPEVFPAALTPSAEPLVHAALPVNASGFQPPSRARDGSAAVNLAARVGAFEGAASAAPGSTAGRAAPSTTSTGAFDRSASNPGADGGKQILASAGFSAGIEDRRLGEVSAPPPETRQPGAGGFDALARKTVAPQATAESRPRITPVEILAKPKPVYTAEARALGIEGQVTLAVLFTAAGHVRVLRVEHGLGHGLDEAAILAAQKISFRAAQIDGGPVDYPATVQIVFQLAF